MGHDVTENKILSALSTLENSGIYVTNLIIDDGWQSIDSRGHGQFQRGMTRFEAKQESFPAGLKAAVSRIRQEHPNIRHVAVWHALLGYWGGIAPTGEIANEYATTQVVREDPDPRNVPVDGKMTVVGQSDIARFFDDFYRFLSDAGIDAVKADAQCMVDSWTGASARRDLIASYLDAWTQTSQRHFGIRAISCMSQIPQILFRCYLPRHGAGKPIVRNSDDFFPEVPASQPLHIWLNAHNSIFTQHLDLVPDWDMFQTVGEYAEFHAAARCISGGPIYITDLPGQHNTSLIRQMSATTPDGRTTILRLKHGARSISAYNAYEDDLLLKLGAYHGLSTLSNTDQIVLLT